MSGIDVHTGPITTIRISRPSTGNAVTPRLLEDFRRLVASLEQDEEVRALVITGAGSHFCSGADLGEITSIWHSEGEDDVIRYLCEVWMPSVQEAFLTLARSSKFTIAAINGAASGGGLDLALCCDFRMAVADATLTESYVRLGLLPVGGGLYHLSQVAGPGTALRMCLSGAPLQAVSALRLGIVDAVIEHREELMTRAKELATTVTSSADAALISDTKRTLASRPSLAEHLAEALAQDKTRLRSIDGRRRLFEAIAAWNDGHRR